MAGGGPTPLKNMKISWDSSEKSVEKDDDSQLNGK